MFRERGWSFIQKQASLWVTIGSLRERTGVLLVYPVSGQLRVYFIVNPQACSKEIPAFYQCTVIRVNCVFKRLCKFGCVAYIFLFRLYNFCLWMNFLMATLRLHKFSIPLGLLSKRTARGMRWLFCRFDFLVLLKKKVITERVKVCYCSSYQQTSHLPLVLTGILWLLIILSNSSLIFLYFSSVRGVSA